jgi:hypothetical protein
MAHAAPAPTAETDQFPLAQMLAFAVDMDSTAGLGRWEFFERGTWGDIQVPEGTGLAHAQSVDLKMSGSEGDLRLDVAKIVAIELAQAHGAMQDFPVGPERIVGTGAFNRAYRLARAPAQAYTARQIEEALPSLADDLPRPDPGLRTKPYTRSEIARLGREANRQIMDDLRRQFRESGGHVEVRLPARRGPSRG